MKLKLNNLELTALMMLFKEAAEKYDAIIKQDVQQSKKIAHTFNRLNATDQDAIMEMHLYQCLFQQLWVKLQKKAFDVKNKYSITLSGSEAAAIHIEFAGIYPPETFIGNIIMQVCNSIHQQFSSQ